MNGLFFGNIAQSSGVDPRYPVIIMPNPTLISNNHCVYTNLSDIAIDDTTPYKQLDFQFECDSEHIDLEIIKSGRKTQLRICPIYSQAEDTILHVTVTDLDGFTTKKDITLKVDETI